MGINEHFKRVFIKILGKKRQVQKSDKSKLRGMGALRCPFRVSYLFALRKYS